MTFNEITKNVVQESIARPREIDQNLVDAQQARRVLDRIVGYELSPLLWKKVRRGLSAGRVQSVATRMVDEREKEIESFKPEEYWTLDAQLLDEPSHKTFTAHYYGKNGKKFEPSSREEIDAVIADTKSAVFVVKSVKRADKQRSPSPPFTTSTLQQEASRKLNMTPRRTMAIAQQLYEGVDIAGRGHRGPDHLYAYRLAAHERGGARRREASSSSAATARTIIPPQTRRYKAKAGAQDAHEAIRPSQRGPHARSASRVTLRSEQYRLYRLIWSRFLASQMANAVYDSVAVEIASGVHEFRASAEQPEVLRLHRRV